MSIIYKYGSEICKANTNTSTAKFQWTIPKAPRFREENYKPEKHGKYQLYTLPSTLSKRFTKFGYGTKSDFTRGDKNYKPDFYDKGTDFDQKNPHGPKYSFSCGREKYGKVYLETNKLLDMNVPGPGKYNYLKPFGSDAPKVSFKGKIENPETRKKKEGEDIGDDEKSKTFLYPSITIQIRPSGKYPVSQIPNVNTYKFDKDKSKRTQFVANRNPGPGTYEMKQLLGRIFPSQYRSNEPYTIARRYKQKDSRTNYPGPGSYIMPSDFGIYLSKNWKDFPQENVYVEEKKKDEDPKPWRHGMKKIKPKKTVEEDEEKYEDNNQENEENQNQGNENEEQTPENKVEEQPKEKEEEKDKESEILLLRDLLMYREGEGEGTSNP